MAKKQFGIIGKGSLGNYQRFRTGLPLVASQILSNQFEEHFRKEGYFDINGAFHKWPARKSGGTRGILTKTGRMRRSLKASPRGDMARVVTDVSYFQAHDEGFKGSVSVRAHTRKRYITKKVKYKTRTGRTRNKKVKEVDKSSGAIRVKAHRRKVNLPKRQVFSDAKPAFDEIDQHIFDSLDKIFLK